MYNFMFSTAFSTDDSPLLFSLGLWKFNNSLSMNSDFQTKIKFNIKIILETLEMAKITNFQLI